MQDMHTRQCVGMSRGSLGDDPKALNDVGQDCQFSRAGGSTLIGECALLDRPEPCSIISKPCQEYWDPITTCWRNEDQQVSAIGLTRSEIVKRVSESRIAQGLSPRIEDPGVLALMAAAMTGAVVGRLAS
jgi:hypothetical protein